MVTWCCPSQAGINCMSMPEEINKKGVSDKIDINICIALSLGAGAI